jgi:hypothetical protein
MITLNFGQVAGLPEEEQNQLNKLVKIYNYHQAGNQRKRRYYDGRIRLSEVNLGIALPRNMSKLDIGCSWGEKAVDVLAARSMFDGFVAENGNTADTMTEIVKRNRLIAEYQKACRDELLFGSTFACLSGGPDAAVIRFYSPQCAAAAWNNEKGRIDCGFAFQDAKQDESDINWSPMYVNLYTDTATWVLSRETGHWIAEKAPHKFGRPLMEPLIWNASSDKPFGQSRIKSPIRKLIQGYVRTMANATIALEFDTSPQKYILGVTDEQYDAITQSKFDQYVGSIIAATQNPESGSNPVFGQLNQGTLSPHTEMLRILATQFSAATGLTVTDTGVVNDANPTSADAVIAQSQTLIALAGQLNTGNGDGLYQIAQMAQAIELGTTPDALPDEDRGVMAHFRNPAMPTVAETTDAATKIASARPEFASTDTFLEMVGFDQADIRRIKAQEQRVRGQQLLNNLTEEEGTNAAGGESSGILAAAGNPPQNAGTAAGQVTS